jgi:hypothetical protein
VYKKKGTNKAKNGDLFSGTSKGGLSFMVFCLVQQISYHFLKLLLWHSRSEIVAITRYIPEKNIFWFTQISTDMQILWGYAYLWKFSVWVAAIPLYSSYLMTVFFFG